MDTPTPPKSEPKPPSRPYGAAQKIVKKVELERIRFAGFSAESVDSNLPVPAEAEIKAATRFSRPLVTPCDTGFSTKTTLVLNVGWRLEGSEEEERPYAVIRATMESRYRYQPDVPAFDQQDLDDFSLCYSVFHVWGFWREFAQSTLAKLDTPVLTLPFFMINQAPKMVSDAID